MITLHSIDKSYTLAAGPQFVLRDVSLEVAAGEFVTIMGPSGSVKTSLLSVLGLLDSDWRGEYRFDGQPLHALRERERKSFARDRIGFVFQHYHLLDDLTVAENLDLPLDYRDLPRAERRARVDAVLERFGLADKRDEYPDRLSGGQQQRAAIVRALAMKPDLLLLDEITAALDPELVAEVLDVIRELAAEGMTLVIATHEMGFARDVANRICFLDEGVILEEGKPREMFAEPRHERTTLFLSRIL